jgi:4-hydroxy-3-polyprenylbenzoate decarboxylase
MKRFVVAMTGASGARIGLRVLEELLKQNEVHLVISNAAFTILEQETFLKVAGKKHGLIEETLRELYGSRELFLYPDDFLEAPIASGSFKTDAMLVAPCSMKTLSAIANGYASGLVERAADVTIKEGRKLVLAPREVPFSAIHLENMLKLARLGVVIAPPVAAFYYGPQNLDELIDFFAGKLLDSVGVEHGLFRRWKEKEAAL